MDLATELYYGTDRTGTSQLQGMGFGAPCRFHQGTETFHVNRPLNDKVLNSCRWVTNLLPTKLASNPGYELTAELQGRALTGGICGFSSKNNLKRRGKEPTLQEENQGRPENQPRRPTGRRRTAAQWGEAAILAAKGRRRRRGARKRSRK